MSSTQFRSGRTPRIAGSGKLGNVVGGVFQQIWPLTSDANQVVTGLVGSFNSSTRQVTVSWDTPNDGTITLKYASDLTGDGSVTDATPGTYTFQTPIDVSITSVVVQASTGPGGVVSTATINTSTSEGLQPNTPGNLLSQSKYDAGPDVDQFTLEGAGQSLASSTEWGALGGSSIKVLTTSLSSVTLNSGPRPLGVGENSLNSAQVTPGTTYAASVTVRNVTVDPSCLFTITIKWRDSTGALLSTVQGTPLRIEKNSTGSVTAVAKAPTGAAYAYPLLCWTNYRPSTGTYYLFDGWEFKVSTPAVITPTKPASNLLTVAQYDAGTDLTQFAVDGTGFTLSATDSWTSVGGNSLRVTTGTGTAGTTGIRTAGTAPVTAGTIYTATADVHNSSASTLIFGLQARWFNSSGSLISTTDYSRSVNSLSEATLSLTAAAPAGTTSAAVVVRGGSDPFPDTSTFEFDRVQLRTGLVTARATAQNWHTSGPDILNGSNAVVPLKGANIGVSSAIGGNVYSDESASSAHVTAATEWGWNIVRITTYACREVSWIGSGNGKFQANTAYRASNDRIYQAGKQYRPVADFTSGTSFNAADWTATGSTSSLAGRDTAITKTFAAVDRYLAAGFVVILAEMSITSGNQSSTSGKLDDIEDFLTQAAARYTNDKRVWLNVNEPTGINTAQKFQDFNNRFYAAARTSGNTNIYIADIMTNAQDGSWHTAPLASDDTVGPAFISGKTNVAFGLHDYGGIGENVDDQATFDTKYGSWLSGMRSKNLPVVIAETGYRADGKDQAGSTGDRNRNVRGTRSAIKLAQTQRVPTLMWDATFDKFGLKQTFGSGGNHSQSFFYLGANGDLSELGKEWWDFCHTNQYP